MSMVLTLVAAAQPGTIPQKPASSNAPSSVAPHALHISSGDLLDVGVFDTPELSGKLRVNEFGDIALPIAGMVRVEGLTSDEAAVAVENKLRSKQILQSPHVSIFISEYATQGVTVSGEVKTPGIYPLLGSHSVLDLVSAAGGVTPSASKSVTISHKSDPQHPEVIILDTKPGSVIATTDISPGDTITVSRCGVVYVIGDVGKPGGFLVENNDRLTVLQAIALAQGANRTASQNKSRLIRKGPAGREELPVPLKRILAGKNVDPPLEDGDILFVPSSEAKNLAYRGVEATIGIASSIIVYDKVF
jgi:polysaccharide export outer membrane protein